MRQKRKVLLGVVAMTEERLDPALTCGHHDFVDQPAFANSGFAHNRDEASAILHRRVERARQPREFAVAPDEWRLEMRGERRFGYRCTPAAPTDLRLSRRIS